MEFLTALWMPILLSAVFVFIVSSIIHMATPMHKADYKKLKKEEAILAAIREHGVEPGAYMFPCCESMKDMKSPEMVEKWKTGPVGMLTVMPPGGCNMGKSLAGWFGYCVLIGVMVAYIAWHAVTPGTPYLRVFQIAGAAAFLGYAVGGIPNTIWKGEKLGTTMKFVFDGLLYALVTAGTFGAFWPGPA